MTALSTNVRIADLIRDLWPHRMSGEAARQIRAIFLDCLAAEVRAVNQANGWFDETRSFGDGIALLHSEVSEMLEAFRADGLAGSLVCKGCGETKADDGGASEHCDRLMKPEGVGSEAADILIRLLDECDRQGIDLQAEFDRKLAYNATRGHKHGGRTL